MAEIEVDVADKFDRKVEIRQVADFVSKRRRG
jgi:hypothetical protein